MPQYIQSLINEKENKKKLGDRNKLVLLIAKATTYGFKSTSYTLLLRRGMPYLII